MHNYDLKLTILTDTNYFNLTFNFYRDLGTVETKLMRLWLMKIPTQYFLIMTKGQNQAMQLQWHNFEAKHAPSSSVMFKWLKYKTWLNIVVIAVLSNIFAISLFKFVQNPNYNSLCGKSLNNSSSRNPQLQTKAGQTNPGRDQYLFFFFCQISQLMQYDPDLCKAGRGILFVRPEQMQWEQELDTCQMEILFVFSQKLLLSLQMASSQVIQKTMDVPAYFSKTNSLTDRVHGWKEFPKKLEQTQRTSYLSVNFLIWDWSWLRGSPPDTKHLTQKCSEINPETNSDIDFWLLKKMINYSIFWSA